MSTPTSHQTPAEALRKEGATAALEHKSSGNTLTALVHSLGLGDRTAPEAAYIALAVDGNLSEADRIQFRKALAKLVNTL